MLTGPRPLEKHRRPTDNGLPHRRRSCAVLFSSGLGLLALSGLAEEGPARTPSPVSSPISTSHLPSSTSLAAFNLVTWNVAGLNYRRFHHLSSSPVIRNASVVFLQECQDSYRTLNPASPRNDRWGRLERLGFSGVITWDAGVLFRPRWTIQAVHRHKRYVSIHVTFPAPLLAFHGATSAHLISLHNPPTTLERSQMWASAEHPLAHVGRLLDKPLIIIGADWNAVPSPHLDVLQGSTGASFALNIRELLAAAELVDLYRAHAPSGRSASRVFMGNLSTSARRIDSIWGPSYLLPFIRGIDFLDGPSDHRQVHYRLHLPSSTPALNGPLLELGPAFWRLHPGVFANPAFARAITSWADQFSRSVAATEYQDPIRRWTHFHQRLTVAAYHASLPVGEAHRKAPDRIDRLQKQLSALDLTLPASRASFTQMVTRLLRLMKLCADQEVMGLSHPEVNRSWRPTSWLTEASRTRSSTVVLSLYDHDGSLVTDFHALPDIVHRFYSSLFHSTCEPNTAPRARERLLSYARWSLTPAQRAALDAPFTLHELKVALEASRFESAAGVDGLPYPLLQLVSATLLPVLLQALNTLQSTGTLPADLVTLRGVLLPKLGDLQSLFNFRPLSIANTTMRIIGRAISNRLQALDGFWPPLQHGFVRHRTTDDSAMLLQAILHAIKSGHEQPTLMVILDQEKAYDRVDHDWLDAALERYGFGPTFRRLLRGVYSNAQVIYTINGWPTEPIKMRCGLLQGDPASPLLYNIALQPLLDALQEEGLGVQLRPHISSPPTATTLHIPYLAFADDVITFVRTEAQLDKLQQLLALYGAASNGKVSLTKTKVIPLTHPSDVTSLDGLLQLSPWPAETAEEISHLGHPLRPSDAGIAHQHLHARFAAITSRRHQLRDDNVALATRLRLVKTLLLPKVWHATRLAATPMHFLAQLMETIAPYIWRGHRSWIRFDYLVAPTSTGGLGLTHPAHMLVAQSGAVIARWLQRSDAAGDWFRDALHSYLWDVLKTTEAALLLRSGRLWRSRINNRYLACGHLWGRILWTIAQLGLTLTPCWDQYTLEEALVLPWAYAPLSEGQEWMRINGYTARTQHSKVALFGDILWFCPGGNSYWSEHPITTLPISPPPASALRLHWPAGNMRCPHNPANYEELRMLCGYLFNRWNSWYPTLPLALRTTLESTPRHYRAHRDRSSSRQHPRPHTRPFQLDLEHHRFPWRLCQLAGAPLSRYTVRHGRAFLARQTPIVPDWPITATSALWGRVWQYSCPRNLPVDDAIWTSLMLFNHRRTRLAERFERDARPPDHSFIDPDPADVGRALINTMEGIADHGRYPQHFSTAQGQFHPNYSNEIAIRHAAALAPSSSTQLPEGNAGDDDSAVLAACPPGIDDEDEEAPDADEVANMTGAEERALGTIDRTHPRGYCPSPNCFQRDSAWHGYLACPVIMSRIWKPCLALLADFFDRDVPAPLTPRHIILAWGELECPAYFRWRLALWRCLIVHRITQLREHAIQSSLRLGRQCNIHFDAPTEEPLIRRQLLDTLIRRWLLLRVHCDVEAPITRSQQLFLRRWVFASRLLHYDDASKSIQVT